MANKHLSLAAAEGSAPILLTDVSEGAGTSYAQAVDVISTPAASYPDTSTISVFDVDDAPQVILAEANSTRLGVAICNHGDTILYVSLGEAVSATLFTVKILPDGFYELPVPAFRGVITAVRPAGASLSPVNVTELFREVV